MGLRNKSWMGKDRHLPEFRKRLHFTPTWERLISQEAFAKNKVGFLIQHRASCTPYFALLSLIMYRCLEPGFSEFNVNLTT